MTGNLAAAAAYSGTTSYAYDNAQTGGAQYNREQLTQEQSSRSGGYTNVFGYDSGATGGPGNPTSFRGTGHTYNADNQDTANTYDGNGSPTTYAGVAMVYDPLGRLTSVSGQMTAGYTADGLRAWKQGATGGKTYFLYDGATPVAEVDATGTVQAVNTFGADGLVSRKVGTASTFYAFDAAGNVTERMDGSGSVLSSDMYDGFGARQSTASAADAFGYGGQEGYYTDRETNLLYLTHRYYDPGKGRFLTRDPLGYGGGVDLYAYTANDPTNASDPSGLAPDTEYDGIEDAGSDVLSNKATSTAGMLSERDSRFVQGGFSAGSDLLHQVPVVGNILGATDALTGCDYAANQSLGAWGRVMGGLQAITPAGAPLAMTTPITNFHIQASSDTDPIFLTPTEPQPTGNNTQSSPGTDRCDFGSHVAGQTDTIDHLFLLRNATAKAVTVERVQPSCSCTTAFAGDAPNAPPPTIAPGGWLPVHVSVDPSRLAPGPLEKSVWVFLKGQVAPAATLVVTGTLTSAAPTSEAAVPRRLRPQCLRRRLPRHRS